MAAIGCHVMPASRDNHKRGGPKQPPTPAAEWLRAVSDAEAEAGRCGVTLAAVQIFLSGPAGYSPLFDAEGLRALAGIARRLRVVVHSSYMPNMWHEDAGRREGARKYVGAQIYVCRGLGLEGFVVHLPDAPVPDVVAAARDAMMHADRRAPRPARKRGSVRGGAGPPAGPALFLETSACSRTHRYATAEDIGALLRALAAAGLPRVGVCLDTAHIHAAGVDLGDLATSTAWVGSLTRQIEAMPRCPPLMVHFNDNMLPLGGRRDMHGAIGTGAMWGGSAAGAVPWLGLAERFKAVLMLERGRRAQLPTDYAWLRATADPGPPAANPV